MASGRFFWIYLIVVFLEMKLSSCQVNGAFDLNVSNCTLKDSSRASRSFSYSLYLAVARMESYSANIMLSPVAIGTSLAMVLAGASETTRTQIALGLRLDVGPRYSEKSVQCMTGIYNRDTYAGRQSPRAVKKTNFDGTELLKASKLFGDRAFYFKKTFLKRTGQYGERMEMVNFRRYPEMARRRINRWVWRSTNGKMRRYFDEGTVNMYTKLAVVSTLYFKGTWQKIFREYDTTEGSFYVSEEQTVQAQFMDNIAYYRTLRLTSPNVDFVELPYKALDRSGIDASMILLMPRDDTPFNSILPLISENRLGGFNGAITQLLARKLGYINIKVPKFNVTTNHDVKAALKKMGIRDVFHRNNAHLTEMVYRNIGEQPLYINSIVHKTVLGISERGTEAFGATGIGMGYYVSPPTMKFDRPFMVIILEKVTNTILFIGRISDPTK